VAKASRPALAIAAALPPDVRAKVVLVVVSPDGAELRLRPEGTVKLGSLDRLDEKLRTTETLLARADLRRLAVLDVRVPANPVLTRQP
jgi:hypothetical protein